MTYIKNKISRCKMVNTFILRINRTFYYSSTKKRNITLPFNSCVFMYETKSLYRKYNCTAMIMKLRLTIPTAWNQPSRSSTDWFINIGITDSFIDKEYMESRHSSEELTELESTALSKTNTKTNVAYFVLHVEIFLKSLIQKNYRVEENLSGKRKEKK